MRRELTIKAALLGAHTVDHGENTEQEYDEAGSGQADQRCHGDRLCNNQHYIEDTAVLTDQLFEHQRLFQVIM